MPESSFLVTFSSTTCDLVSQYRPPSRAAAHTVSVQVQQEPQTGGGHVHGNVRVCLAGVPVLTVRFILVRRVLSDL
jgi:hypothetical protein